jgi:fatty acid desaturase
MQPDRPPLDEAAPAPRATIDAGRIPGVLNITLALAIVAGGVALQVLAARASSRWVVAAAGIGFAFLFLPLYSLLHECEHRVFHDRPRINDGFGLLLAAFFPGPFTFLRACHLGHHRRNRSDAEMFDLYYPTDRLAWKRCYFYALYLGAFWLSVPLATVILLLWPRVLRGRLLQDAPSAAAMINGVPPWWLARIRLECLATVLLHAGLIVGLHLPLATYALLYGLYGVSWSSQQYVTHAASPRHALDGAHNLRPHPLYALLLLNFNWHLAHHQHPAVPWIHLPRFDDPTRVRPGYLRAFLRFWRGPQPCTEPPPATRAGSAAQGQTDQTNPSSPA